MRSCDSLGIKDAMEEGKLQLGRGLQSVCDLRQFQWEVHQYQPSSARHIGLHQHLHMDHRGGEYLDTAIVQVQTLEKY